MTLKLKVNYLTYAYIASLSETELKSLRPSTTCNKGKAKGTKGEIFSQVQRFKRQNVCRDGDFMVVNETYTPPASGFPGRLWSPGSQNWWGALRSLLYENYTELDQQCSIHRIVAFICKTFNVNARHLTSFLSDRDTNLRDVMASENCTRETAKLRFQLAWTSDATLSRIKDPFLKAFDEEAKRVRHKLMGIEELKWVVEASQNPGSFMAHLTHFVEAKLSSSVCRALEKEGIHVYSSVFDGIYIDKEHHGSNEIQNIAQKACEDVVPGIGMLWGWKLPDPTVHDNRGNAVDILRVPDDFVPSSAREDEWDPMTQPTYDDFPNPLQEGIVHLGMHTSFSQAHCKVGHTYVDSDKQPGKYAFTDESKLIKEYKHRVTFAPPTVATDADGKQYLKAGGVEKDFITRWLHDPRMDPIYLKDKSMGNYWKYFDCFPNADGCPDDCFNTWRGFAAEDLVIQDKEMAQENLRVILNHIKMMCSENKRSYDFLLELLSHAQQYPERKLGIMTCLVGPKGAGKTQLWNLIQGVFGEASCFETEHPDKDVWGDNNSCIMDKYWIRITEATRKKFAGVIGEMRTKVTDETIRVRALYGAADNVKSFHRYFLDTNYRDAIPDEHGERRFFIVDCSGSKVGDDAYFSRLVKAIKSQDGIRAFYDLLSKRQCKKHYLGPDIPVGEYARKLKDSNRPHAELFVQAIVQDQSIDRAVLTWTDNEVYVFYTKWQTDGHEFDRSKCAVMRTLGLIALPGVSKRKIVDLHSKKWTTLYTFDLGLLRKHYGMERDIEEAHEAINRAEIVAAANAKGSCSMIDYITHIEIEREPAIDIEQDIKIVFGAASDEPQSKRFCLS